MNVWESLAGRAPAEPSGPVDPGLWGAVVDRLNPARARPVLRAGIEAVQLTGVRGTAYIMLRSPDDGERAGYLRLTPEEWQLALLMDGEFTVTLLVAEFARISGRLAPDQVHRVVADLAGNRMLAHLPGDAFRPLQDRRKPLPARAARGRRVLVFKPDRLVTALYRAGGAAFFNRIGAVFAAVLGVLGLLLFGATWSHGSQSLFLAGGGSYLAGAILLIVLNAGVLVVYQLARALAVKHSGREVSAAGLRAYFGIPSLFVDTSDVWMAGRRARMLVAASGPLSAVLLAGLAQLAGFALPFLAGLTFKLAFLFYLNAFFRLSPLLPLDGHYLLTDWLEIPQVRARALAWMTGRLRWSSLDREGRLIALYGYLSVAWLAFAVALTVLVWSGHLSGLAIGLGHDGFFDALLFLLIVLGVASPAVLFLLARLSRWWGTFRNRRAEKDSALRLAALRSSDLGGLPEAALNGLAARVRWEHLPSGRQIVHAGSAQPAIYVVVEGGLAARLPGDPPGTIRHQVGPGGVVGLVNALTGRPAELDWHTSGTSLLAISAATVATVVGPLPGPLPQDRAEAEALFGDTPALADLSVDQRLAFVGSAHPVDLDAGAPVILHGPTHAVVVESGVIALQDGVELRRGTLVGPVGEGHPGAVAQTRTPVRLWVLPDASDLPPLVGGTHLPGSPIPVVSVNRGLRPGAPGGGTYPPLAVPAEPPQEPADPSLDRSFEKRLWAATTALLALALAVTGMTFRPGPAWAEMPTSQVLLTVDGGQSKALIDGKVVSLGAGASRYLRTHDQIEVTRDAGTRLTFKGGAVARLCPGSRVEIGALSTGAGRQQTPSGTLNLVAGRIVADTASASGAYAPLILTVSRSRGAVVNEGAASFVVDRESATSAGGKVTAGGEAVPEASTMSCGDALPAAPLSPLQESTEAPFPADTGVPSAAVTNVPTPPASPSATVEAPLVTTLQPIAPPSSRAGSAPTPTRPATSRPTFTRPTPHQPLPSQTPSTPPPTPTDEPTSTPPTPDPTTTTEGVRAPSN